jgi:transcriptional regulator with XRE-family HTH domain
MKGQQLNWPKIIEEVRQLHHWSQKDLADRFSVSQATVSRWENGLDAPGLTRRRQLLALYRTANWDRSDMIVRARVRNAFWPSSLIGPGAIFLEINQAALREVGLPPRDLRGQPIYGMFGGAVDAVTEKWEESGIFRGEVAMTTSLNVLTVGSEQVHLRTLDTPHFTAHGAVWCICDLQRISREMYDDLYESYGGPTFVIPFEDHDAAASPAGPAPSGGQT